MSKAQKAVLAFLGHGPALRLFTDFRFTPELLRKNLLAVGATLVATGLGFAAIDDHRLLAASCAFAIGHVAWGLYLARVVLRSD